MTIGKLAKQAGVHLETVRYYERRGLIPEPPRRPSGYREYPAESVARIRFIKRAQELGFSLQKMKRALVKLVSACRRGGPKGECPILEALSMSG